MTNQPKIIDLKPTDGETIAGLSQLVHDSFSDFAPDWLPTVAAAREEVIESLQPGRLSRVLVDCDEPIGWVSGVHAYGYVWELHPLVVAKNHRRKGHGRRLVDDLERLVSARGALTLQLGTSDETDRTTAFGVDLYENPAKAVAQLRTLREHPMDFYVAVGFKVVGLIPDAEGQGKPTIILAKRVSRSG
jgi:aminoglycoside 6'-N-acetyltransferase I